MNVLVYSGPGTSSAAVALTRKSLKRLLSNGYDVMLAPAQMVIEQPWTDSSSLFVMPDGEHSEIAKGLGPSGIDRIRQWVFDGGGIYLGIGNGAQLACSPKIKLDSQQWMSLYPGYCMPLESKAGGSGDEDIDRNTKIMIQRESWKGYWTSSLDSIQVLGKCTFSDPSSSNLLPTDAISLASYANRPEASIAALRCSAGKGQAILMGYELDLNSKNSSISHQNVEWLKQLLLMMNLNVSDQLESSILPTPQLLLSLYPHKLNTIKTQFKAMIGPEEWISDTQDDFSLHNDENQITQLPPTSDEKDHFQLVIISDISYRPKLATSFEWNAYFEAWRRYNLVNENPSDCTFGSVVLYAESVTSTQSLLEKNSKLTSVLPNGLVFIAKHQTSGRGRGKNFWISSAGCAQFSLLLKIDKNQGSGVIFLQYLFGLAVIESVLNRPGYEALPIRLKWPNDLYGSLKSPSQSDPSENLRHYKKLGGILVNGSFNLHECVMVIGCGINNSNSQPSTSLDEVIDKYNEVNPNAQLKRLSHEDLIAGILSTFDRMMKEFLIKGFKPFEKRYLSTWLHSNQIVRLEDTDEMVKIHGITLNHGLLRTKKVVMNFEGEWVEDGEVIDLQPNSNSFDMMSGLIKTKT
ncbi:uncharacterized protein MELLADRAFT_69028 [Melampsora larici-populina 98AG31]|uniref:BPL/LPL catalytic domain-containing protein n=1 Tax=Melampsora larici-populina (strain 98AG31 / pathotype 3-4-7) TaxID=747676 RepID=F4S953_MELLP|nr:uncharacterized protein MELLADRAFT_69028 [Melampsora larici-populina 98AG31]EGF98825.1 hypothetical protein MELLADRAFT_69028 [Melampsora larici-populina 98AG31]